ncbi:hypothetical protein J6G99_09045 [bacterium]|nr:hypothetical protein [bacterium]
MGIGLSLSNLTSKAIKYAIYGRQIGNTAKNGAQVFKKGNVITGLNSNQEVISTITKNKISQNTIKTVTVKNKGIDEFGCKLTEETTVTRTDTKDGGDIFLSRKSYADINGSKIEQPLKRGTIQFSQVNYDKVNGKKVFNSGCTDSLYLDKDNHLWNFRNYLSIKK